MKRAVVILAVFIAMAKGSPSLGEEKSGVDVLILKFMEYPQYEKLISGFRSVFKGSVSMLNIIGSLENPKKLTAKIKKINPKVILSFTRNATRRVLSCPIDKPVVFALVSGNKIFDFKRDNATGVHLDPELKEQFLAFKRFIPGLKRIGAVYDPKKTGEYIKKAIQTATSADIELVLKPVNSRDESYTALEELVGLVDAFWFINDDTVSTREFFNKMLDLQEKKKIPVIAHTRALVLRGAVCAFSADLISQGKTAAEIVQSILDGKSPKDIPIQHPKGMVYFNNEAAKKAGVKIPKTYFRHYIDINSEKGNSLNKENPIKPFEGPRR